MNYLKQFIIIAGVCVLFTVSYAQESLSVSFASFKNLIDDKGNYTELYYVISRDELQFMEKDSIFVATFKTDLEIEDENGKTVVEETNNSGFSANSKNQTDLSRNLNDMLKFYLKPGKYHYQLMISGEGLKWDLTKEGVINIPDYSDDKLRISDIELCTNISTELSFQKFVKNNLLVYPNPSGIYDIQKPIVFFYAEIYNLDFGTESASNDFETSFIIANEYNDTIKVYPTQQKIKAGKTSVIASYVNVRKMETGKYQLIIRVKDKSTSQIAESKKMFSINQIANITNKDAELFRKLITYIATRDELEIYDKLNLIGKQTFMNSFWQKKDPITETTENEFKQDYLQRWIFVNRRYKHDSLTEEGWETDRGRIYLIHGAPSEIDRHNNDIDMKNYEIWYYEQEQSGTKYFVFADMEMRGNYTLIHSVSPNQQEVYNPNWKKQVTIVPYD